MGRALNFQDGGKRRRGKYYHLFENGLKGGQKNLRILAFAVT